MGYLCALSSETAGRSSNCRRQLFDSDRLVLNVHVPKHEKQGFCSKADARGLESSALASYCSQGLQWL